MVTQATVSRDIRDLDLVKVAVPGGSYKYVVSHVSKKSTRGEGILSHSVADTILTVTCAQKFIVLRTNPGMAQAVAISIDRIHDGDILGSVAGDDTIIIVAYDEMRASILKENLKLAFKLN
jgi:transcriptional regulator of arginine metabolism